VYIHRAVIIRARIAIVLGFWKNAGMGTLKQSQIENPKHKTWWRIKKLFLGQYRYSFDDQDGLLMPARFREMLADGGYVTQGFDRNLVILTPTAFQEIYRLIAALNIADPLARFLHRMILGTATEIQVDDAGRIVLPGNLRTFANLAGEAVLIGQGDYFEVWAPGFWSQQEAYIQDAEANATRFIGLNLARS